MKSTAPCLVIPLLQGAPHAIPFSLSGPRRAAAAAGLEGRGSCSPLALPSPSLSSSIGLAEDSSLDSSQLEASLVMLPQLWGVEPPQPSQRAASPALRALPAPVGSAALPAAAELSWPQQSQQAGQQELGDTQLGWDEPLELPLLELLVAAPTQAWEEAECEAADPMAWLDM